MGSKREAKKKHIRVVARKVRNKPELDQVIIVPIKDYFERIKANFQ